MYNKAYYAWEEKTAIFQISKYAEFDLAGLIDDPRLGCWWKQVFFAEVNESIA